MQDSKRSLLVKGIQGTIAAALLAVGQSAVAANITVRVVDAQTLEPVSGAAVCLGLKGQPQAFGALRTDAAGEVMYGDTPHRNFILSVAGNGSGSYAREQTPRNFDIIYYVALDKREFSTDCLAPVKHNLGQGKSALDLLSIDVKSHSHHAGTVDVATRVSGVEPTHIRVSTSADFKGSSWKAYRHVTRHDINRVAAKDLYVQVKRLLDSDGNTIEAVSTTRVGDLHWD